MQEFDNYLEKISTLFHPATFHEFKNIEKIKSVKEDQRQVDHVIDLFAMRPKYGEALLYIQQAYILKAIGIHVRIVVILTPSDCLFTFGKQKIKKVDKTMTKARTELVSFLALFCNQKDIPCKIFKGVKERMMYYENAKNRVLFAEALAAIKNLKPNQKLKVSAAHLNNQLLRLLIIKYNSELLLKKPEEYLLGNFLKSTIPRPKSKYLSTNFRCNSARTDRNGKLESLIQRCEYFYARYRLPTMIATCEEGYSALKTINNNPAFFVHKPGNFIADMCFMVNSLMVYQDNGGGITTPCLLSNNIPYCVQVDKIGKNTIPFSNHKFWSFSSDVQVFNQRASNSSFDSLHNIKKIIEIQLKGGGRLNGSILPDDLPGQY